MTPRISIIIPLFNKERFVKETIISILSQNIYDYEIVIINDGSTDNSLNVVKENFNDKRIHIYGKKNGGPSSARNYGIIKARGEWILFLDADDTLEKNALQTVKNDISKHKYADIFCYSEYCQENKKKWIFPQIFFKGYVFFPFIRWYLEQIYPGPGRMVAKKKCFEEEPFREDLKRWEDGECIFRLMRKYRFYANPTPLFTYYRDNNSASKPLDNYKEDYCCNLDILGKPLFEKIALYKLYKEACSFYPEQIDYLYGNAFKGRIFTTIIRLLDKWKHIKLKNNKLIITNID